MLLNLKYAQAERSEGNPRGKPGRFTPGNSNTPTPGVEAERSEGNPRGKPGRFTPGNSNTPTPGVEPGHPEGSRVPVLCNTVMRRGPD